MSSLRSSAGVGASEFDKLNEGFLGIFLEFLVVPFLTVFHYPEAGASSAERTSPLLVHGKRHSMGMQRMSHKSLVSFEASSALPISSEAFPEARATR